MHRRAAIHYPDLWNGPGVPRGLPRIGEAWRQRLAADGADALAGCCAGHHRRPAQSAAALLRQGDRAAADLCRPGGDRDPERAAVQRDQGGAGAADRYRRDPAGHQPARRPTCSRCSTPSCAARPNCSSPATPRSRLLQDGWLHWRGGAGGSSEWMQRVNAVYPIPLGSGTRAVGAGHRANAARSRSWMRMPPTRRSSPAQARQCGAASASARACVPLLRDGQGIGTLILTHPQVGLQAQRRAARAAADLRRPGGDRDRERAAVQRDAGSAGAADRHRRGAAGHRQLGSR